MKKIDKNLVFTVILSLVMLFLALKSVAMVCGGFANVIMGYDTTADALRIVSGLLIIAPVTFFGFRLLDKADDNLKLIASLTNLAVIVTLFVFAVVIAATKSGVGYAPDIMVADALVVIGWFLLDFQAFKRAVCGFKIVKVETPKEEPKAEETVEETVEEAPTEIEEKPEE